jgi:hypothetical protein
MKTTDDKLNFHELPADKHEAWGAGPWCDEPDRVEFDAHGLPCLMQRIPMGTWCGYVAVPPGHPLHGKQPSARVFCADRSKLAVRGIIPAFLEAMREDDDSTVSLDVLLDVHGGLTYADACHGKICHVPKPGEPDNVWWFGFDCGHCDDLSPGLAAVLGVTFPGATYKNAAYVREQCEALALQLRALASA